MTRPRTELLVALALALAVVAVYLPVASHDWVKFDDDVYLTANPHVARGLDAREILWVFTHDYAANYHPLTWVSHMLDVELFGMASGAHHLVSVLLHALNAALVFLFLRALFPDITFPDIAAAAFGAALFALHPLRVESVAWASERKDVLCAAFSLATLLAYLRYARAPSRARYAWVCLALVLALLSKPMAVTLPGVALLLDVWPLARTGSGRTRARLLEKLPLFALAGLAALVTLWVQSRGGATSSLGSLAWQLRLLNAFAALAAYLGQTLWPAHLCVFYPHAAIVAEHPVSALLAPALCGLLLLVALSALAWRLRARAPAVGLGWWIFLLTLAPVLGLVQVGTQAHADRYTYLPSVGASVLLVGAALALGARATRPVWAGGTLLVVLLAGLTRQQLATWRDTRSLFEHALRASDRNYMAHLKLGELALEDGELDQASAAFLRALAIDPDHVEALNNQALCQLQRGELDDARALLEHARRIHPDDADTLLNLGAVELERGELAAAEQHLEASLARAPEKANVHFNLGNLRQRQERPAEAEQQFRAALALDERHHDAWSNLGQVLLGQGRMEEAIAAFERVTALVPEDAVGHFNLGIALRKAGQAARAAGELRRALELEPDLELARTALLELDPGGK